MANVVDPNSWRMIPVPDPHQNRQAEDALGSPTDAVAPRVAIDVLNSALKRSFAAPGDRVIWNLADLSTELSAGGQQMRVDLQHSLSPPVGHFPDPPVPQPIDFPRPWLVLVENATDLRLGKHAERLRAALEHDSALLLLVCDVDEAAGARSAGDTDPVTRIALRLHCDFIGPVTAGNPSDLADAFARVKLSGRSTVLYLDARKSSAPPHHFPPAEAHPADETQPSVETGSLRQIAAEALVRLANQDGRIAAFSTDVDPILPTTWESSDQGELTAESRVSFAIGHCAAMAARGSKPFLFLSVEEAINYLGAIRREICLERRGVTLVVEARRSSAGAEKISSASLAGLRHLPGLSLLSPKDGTELCQMLHWCTEQTDPAVIWLPDQWEPPVTWPQGTPIVRGRAERLGVGDEVTIIAWGTQAAAAAIAAEHLSQRGIGATVVNARFAQPLDIETLVQAAADSTYAVLVDDAEEGGGFASWVAEQLLEAQLADRIVLVRHQSSPDQNNLQEAHAQCAAAIVERCQWLAEPISPDAPVMSISPVELCAATPELAEVADSWVNYLHRHADRTARDRTQVLARTLSPDVLRWVRAYEEVGSRDVYLWQWCALGVELTTLPCVRPELRAHVCDTKVLSIVLCVLLDDVADEHGNGQLLEALLEMSCREPASSLRGLDAVETRHAEITRALWTEYWARVATYPCAAEFEPVLRYDLLQFQNTMRYSHLVNERPYLINLAEHDLYTSHNMMMISFATLDLMCSPGFVREEVGALRETIWHAQCMGRNGNLLSTWRRELANRDFTSGVFARAIMQGDLTHDQLEHGDLARLEATIRQRGHETYFFQRWLEHRQLCHSCARRVASVDLRGVLEGHDRFLAMHLGSEGLI